MTPLVIGTGNLFEPCLYVNLKFMVGLCREM
jgi:hypothetical protein